MSLGWFAALFMIVLASWVLYRFAAPRSWKEWSGAGLVQAFIIALYAEMFGFPLTLYLLVRVFRVDVPLTPQSGGNLWYAAFGERAWIMAIAMVVGWGLFVLPGLALLAAGWRQVYRARREGSLATGGVYGIVRHPQYAGLLLALFGEGVVHWPTVFSLALFPFIFAAYCWLARREERAVAAQFPEQHTQYRQRVPMLVPRWSDWPRLLRLLSRS